MVPRPAAGGAARRRAVALRAAAGARRGRRRAAELVPQAPARDRARPAAVDAGGRGAGDLRPGRLRARACGWRCCRCGGCRWRDVARAFLIVAAMHMGINVVGYAIGARETPDLSARALRRRRYSHSAMNGIADRPSSCPLSTSTANWNRPPSLFGTVTNVTWKTSSVPRSTLALRVGGLDLLERRPDARRRARSVAPPKTVMFVTLRGTLLREVDAALERRLQRRRARVGPAELAARPDLADQVLPAQRRVALADLDEADAVRADRRAVLPAGETSAGAAPAPATRAETPTRAAEAPTRRAKECRFMRSTYARRRSVRQPQRRPTYLR